MAIQEANTVTDFDRILSSSSNVLAVVHFFAPWAPHCNQMNDVLEELAKENPHVNFIKVEAEKLPEVSYKNNINAVPTLLLFKNQKVVDRIDGANAPELTKKVEHHASIILPPEPCEQPETQDLTSRLKKLVNSSPCMLFMKGTPQEPKCGFSRQVVGILAGVGAQYSTFDILKDEEVRQGLKKYSDWPTYPQLYINGELVGGLDIIKELATSGELASMLPPKQDLKTRILDVGLVDKFVRFFRTTVKGSATSLLISLRILRFEKVSRSTLIGRPTLSCTSRGSLSEDWT
ncbi:glutaredoxin-3 isoform X3 [Nematostella vectensis]|uniref:glutaredoxin-3 isoform X3 n=1 Tax=Nematostella vectensis TaxID=45351 RepID=UPI00139048AE|nr:glutaredoxin-3 isoform X3 [Nematostella vectensis]